MKSNKVFPILAILVLFASPILITYPSVVSAANPSVPEFTVAYVDHSYDVPVTHWVTTNPYTGEQITHSSGGEHVDNRTIDVTIRYQPFTPFLDGNQTVQLYYSIRSKGHFDDWTDSTSIHTMSEISPSGNSNTIVSINIQYWDVPQGGQIDFQVQAYYSYVTNTYSGSCFTGSSTTRVGESAWAGTQTITVGNPSTPGPTYPAFTTPYPTFNPYNPTPTPNYPCSPTVTPSQPNIITGVLTSLGWEQIAIIAMIVIIACFVVVVAILLRKVTQK